MSRSGRRFLVFVRAGEKSLHRAWLQGGERNWDLVVSWYGEEPYVPVADEIVLPARGWKWDVVAQQLREHPGLVERYDYFWIPDDDIEADAARISKIFDLTSEHGLAVSQPSLTPDSYFSYILMLQCPSFLLRYTDLIEVMVPCLSRDTLKRAMPFFEETPSGFGLDPVWTRLEEDNERKAAYLDAVAVRHTRPVGRFLMGRMKDAGQSPSDDLDRLSVRFGLTTPRRYFNCYASIDLTGRARGYWATAAWMLVDYVAQVSRWLEPNGPRRILSMFRSVSKAPVLTKLVPSD